MANIQNNSVKTNAIRVFLPPSMKFDQLYKGEKALEKHDKRFNDLNAFFVGNLVFKCHIRELPYTFSHNLKAEYLKSFYGVHYQNYLNGLVEADVLKIDHRFFHNKHNSARSFTKKYALNIKAGTPLEPYDITDPFVVKKIRLIRIKERENLIKDNPTARSIYNTTLKTTIDYAGCVGFLREKYNPAEFRVWYRKLLRVFKTKNNIRKVMYDVTMANTDAKKLAVADKYKIGAKMPTVKERKELISYVFALNSSFLGYKKRMENARIWKNIQEGDHTLIALSKDKKGGRIYSNWTATPKDVRQFLKINNKDIYELDASNSQWLILSSVIKKSFIQSIYTSCFFQDSFSFKENKDNMTVEKKIINKKEEKTTHMTLYKWNVDSEKHADMYRNLVLQLATLDAMLAQGTFKSFFTSQYNSLVIPSKRKTESEVKRGLIANALFSDPSKIYMNKNVYITMFKDNFPAIYWAVTRLKTQMLDYEKLGYDEKTRWKSLSIELQRRERIIFVDGMRNCDLDFTTIHDAVLLNYDAIKPVTELLNLVSKKENVNLKLKCNKITREYAV